MENESVPETSIDGSAFESAGATALAWTGTDAAYHRNIALIAA